MPVFSAKCQRTGRENLQKLVSCLLTGGTPAHQREKHRVKTRPTPLLGPIHCRRVRRSAAGQLERRTNALQHHACMCVCVCVCAASSKYTPWKVLWLFYPRDAMLALSLRNRRVRLSVRHTPVLCLAEQKQDREMYTI